MSDTLFTRIYEIVKTIPYGKVATYGQIARAAGNPRASRAVGWALHVNPDPWPQSLRCCEAAGGVTTPTAIGGWNPIPCHRVVNRFGGLSSAFAFGGKDVHKLLLEEEGVKVNDDYTVNLDNYRCNNI